MEEVAKRLGSHLLMHQDKMKHHQSRDVNKLIVAIFQHSMFNFV